MKRTLGILTLSALALAVIGAGLAASEWHDVHPDLICGLEGPYPTQNEHAANKAGDGE